MTNLKKFSITSWDQEIPLDIQKQAVQALEEGSVLYFPALAFPLKNLEHRFLSPKILDTKAKNISYDGRSDRIAGTNYIGNEAAELKALMRRYSITSRQFLEKLIPHYTPHLFQARTSFRPVEIAGRKSSYRKDDSRLHVDSFPSSPTKGERILRVFTNINQEEKPRVWRLGEPLENVLKGFLPKTSSPIWGVASLLQLLRITKGYRTPYDHYMLQIHDSMKGDTSYQKSAPQETISFPPGSSWIVYTDQVSHAAMSGQHVLEQTFHLPVHALNSPSTAPLKVMERLLNKALI